ncbi:MAG TPA: serine/threonine-protein kinase, partial [Planctomycetota bacterium]|nr:serine/threonine-protein kinase [Planctomycetota bacterium]
RAAASSGAPPGPRFAGRYEIRGILGEGSFGVVYLAHDARLDREVALKFLRPQAFSDPQAKDRFLREARSLAAVVHPNVVVVYDLGEVDGSPYLSLERIEGTTLRDALAAAPFTVAETVAVGRALLSALAAIHAAGVVHRDVKPGNVMLARDGRVKLMDFGLARGTAAAFDLTVGGVTAGTPYYMAPEQWRGKSATPRSDLFALGTLLYECLAGRVPFKAGGFEELQQAVLLDQPTPLREIRPDVPEALAAIIERSLAKEPEERHAGAAEMRAALTGLSSGPDETGVLRGKASGLRRPSVLPLSRTFPFRAEATASVAGSTSPPKRSCFLRYAGAAALLGVAFAGIAAYREYAAAREIGLEVRTFRLPKGEDRTEPLTGGSTIHSNESLYFEVRTSEEAYLYVFNVDSSGATFALFPSTGAEYDRTNPFSGGSWHHLPPDSGGRAKSFVMDPTLGDERFYVVASRRPCPALEEALGRMRQVSDAGAPPDLAAVETRRAKRAGDE